MVIVFGSANLDLVARVARLPRPGETLTGLDFAMRPGGKGANQALAARRSGADVMFVGAVGDDAFAAVTLAGLAASNVDLAGVRRVPAPTGVALIHVEASGENCITVVPGANAHADPTAIPESSLGAATTLVLQLEVPLPAVAAAAKHAHARGARVVLNAAPAQALAEGLLAAVDVLVVNEHEASTVAAGLALPPAPEAFAECFHRRFRSAVVITLGARGVVAVAAGVRYAAPAPAVTVVDSTGAGDAFTGALAAALDRGAEWPRALAEGLAAGSLACTAAGAQDALPMAAAIAALATPVQSTLVATRLA
jgi:ribokinase